MMKFPWTSSKAKLPDRNIDDIKRICKILFIDDQNFPVVEILKNSGWINMKRLKDLDSLDQIDLKESHIIFSDIQGVGKKLKFKDEGLGLVIAIKEKYPEKRVIIYSAEDKGRVAAFHRGMNIADHRLNKLSDPYEFQSVFEKFSMEVFSLRECVERVKEIINRELNIAMTYDEVITKLGKVASSGKVSEDNISKIFNLQNASNISSIIQLFLASQ